MEPALVQAYLELGLLLSNFDLVSSFSHLFDCTTQRDVNLTVNVDTFDSIIHTVEALKIILAVDSVRVVNAVN